MKSFKSQSLESLTDKFIGKRGTLSRETFEHELRMDLLSAAIKETRIKRNLTQEKLGLLVGVQKAQISKLENNVKEARLDTIIRVFKALNARVSFQIELLQPK
jgi:DNA-binding XRE family transcriptional regulator